MKLTVKVGRRSPVVRLSPWTWCRSRRRNRRIDLLRRRGGLFPAITLQACSTPSNPALERINHRHVRQHHYPQYGDPPASPQVIVTEAVEADGDDMDGQVLIITANSADGLATKVIDVRAGPGGVPRGPSRPGW